jgi:hypothetical protein
MCHSACAVSLVTLRTPRAQNFPRQHIVPRPEATSTSVQLLAELVDMSEAGSSGVHEVDVAVVGGGPAGPLRHSGLPGSVPERP